MHLYEVLRRPLITEKTALLQEMHGYAFEVEKTATEKAGQKDFVIFFK